MKSKIQAHLIWLILLTLFLQTRCVNSEKITIIDPHSHGVIEYGEGELSSILAGKFEVTRSKNQDPDGWNIILKTDSTMAPFSFSIEQPKNDKYRTIYLKGYDETCVLHSLYTMLEVMGYTFDLTGIRKPKNPSLSKLAGYSKVIHPVVERRGIRQHINFVMDISSYPIEEAKEYIRNLARLRMNYITFHSYPGQWFSYNYKETKNLAGNFFYGEQDVVPQDKSIKKLIRNDSIYCIPSIEPYWNNLQKRSQMAIEWLNAVMAEAKKAGLTIDFSYELRIPGIEFARATSEAILKQYPLIDGIEFITEEDTENYNEQIKNEVSCVNALRDNFRKRNIQISTGIYTTEKEELKKGFELLRNTAPLDLPFTILPAHGARMVASNLEGIPFTPDDLNRTMIYSWIQMDGMMYLQQNPVEGVRLLIDNNLKINNNKPLYGICWNHWQNYENRIAARYASLAMIEGPIPAFSFYISQAKRMGITDTLMYAKAMSKLDETDNYCRGNIVTIGFCPRGWWLKKPGLSHYGTLRYHKDKLLSAIAQYDETKNEINKCIAGIKNGKSKEDLQFLANRIDCSIMYLEAFATMNDLHPLFERTSQPVLSKQDSALVIQKCNEALSWEMDYLQTYSKLVPDRGCEGTIISFYSVPLLTLKNIINKYVNDKETIYTDKQSDEPPTPDI